MENGKTHIVVVDNGFVYVGKCEWGTTFLKMSDAQNLRVWGTTQGLSELCSGPTQKTVHDPVNTALIPTSRIVLMLPCSEGAWE